MPSTQRNINIDVFFMPMNKPEIETRGYELAILVKKYWLSFYKEHIAAERKGLEDQGVYLNDAFNAMLIKELAILFLWVISNTIDDEDLESKEILAKAHNAYLNNLNAEPELKRIHLDILHFDTQANLPVIENQRLMARYGQYSRIMFSDTEDKISQLYLRILSNLFPLQDFNLFTQLYFYAFIHNYIIALRQDFRNFKQSHIIH